MDKAESLSIFISYAQQDERFLIEIEKHLAGLKRKGLLTAWHNQKIRAGENVDKVVLQRLEQSKVILLLISSDYLASDYQYNIELKTAIKLHQQNLAVVIPILVRNCFTKGTPFEKIQTLPQNLVPINTWENPDDAYLDIVHSISQWLNAFSNISNKHKLYANENQRNKAIIKEELKILFLGSSPYDIPRIMYGKEYRKIRQIVIKMQNQIPCEIVAELDVDLSTFQQASIEVQPIVIHFSGPGTADRNGITLHNEQGEAHLIQGNHLADLLSSMKTIKCVLINTVISELQAALIHNTVNCVIGIKDLIKEEACIYFSEGFYQALLGGSNFELAFNRGINQLNLRGMEKEADKYFSLNKQP